MKGEAATIDLPTLAEAIGASYFTLRRWVLRGLAQATIRRSNAAEYKQVKVAIEGAIELAVIHRLRRVEVPLQRIRPAIKELRLRGINGPRWLALSAVGRDVVLCDGGDLERVADGQRFLHLLDVAEIRATVRKIMARKERREATA